MEKKGLSLLQERRVIVWDSGVGGKNIFENISSFSRNVFFFQDKVNFPYGSKDISVLKSLFCNSIKLFNLQSDDILVLACHTISCVYLLLQSELGLACKVFCVLDFLLNGPEGLILCTEFTAIYLNSLNKKALALPDLAVLIENENWGAVKERVEELLISEDVVLYGCTHYPLANQIFFEAFPGKRFYNPETALLADVKSYL